MYSPGSEASDESHRSDATLMDPMRDSIFSYGFTNTFRLHSPPYPHGSVHSYASSRLLEGNGDAVLPDLTHPYLTEPVNPRESRSFRRHADSVLFHVPPSNIYDPVQSQSMAPTSDSPTPQRQAQQANYPSPGNYLAPHVNPTPIDHLNIKRHRRSVSYRNPTQASLYDPEKEKAHRMALDALEGRRTGINSLSSGLVGPDESEARPIHPPVYPHPVLPVNAFEYPGSRDGSWQVNDPVTVKRQDRTRTVKAQYTPEVVRMDDHERSPRVVPDRTQGGNTPHPDAAYHKYISTHEKYHRANHDIGQAPPHEGSQQIQPIETQVQDQCKVRKFDITENRYSTWMNGTVTKPFYLEPLDGIDQSYYWVEFNHPTLGQQEGWFFANRREIKFRKQ